MISRRLLRIKILQILYAHFMLDCQPLDKTEEELLFSIQKSYDLYNYLLLLIIDIVRYANSRIELAKQKKIPTCEDLNPNTKFIDNKLIKQLSNNEQLKKYIFNNKLSWENHPELIKTFYSKITESEHYAKYLNNKNNSYEVDKKIIIKLYLNEIVNCEQLYQCLEEQSIYWNDDIEFVISMIIKTLSKFKEKDNESTLLMKLYKNDDDKDFVKRLLRKTILNHLEYKKLIDEKTKNWDVNRIIFMDILIMQLAIAEMIEFSSIPTRVTFNEYLEISKLYSTKKSSNFINGILDKILHSLKKENIIIKQGRGLIGES